MHGAVRRVGKRQAERLLTSEATIWTPWGGRGRRPSRVGGTAQVRDGPCPRGPEKHRAQRTAPLPASVRPPVFFSVAEDGDSPGRLAQPHEWARWTVPGPTDHQIEDSCSICPSGRDGVHAVRRNIRHRGLYPCRAGARPGRSCDTCGSGEGPRALHLLATGTADVLLPRRSHGGPDTPRSAKTLGTEDCAPPTRSHGRDVVLAVCKNIGRRGLRPSRRAFARPIFFNRRGRRLSRAA
jgi:hypothetical protein